MPPVKTRYWVEIEEFNRKKRFPIEEYGDLAPLVRSWMLALKASKQPKTVKSYLDSVNQFTAFLRSAAMPPKLANITRDHVDAFIAYLRESVNDRGEKRWSASTVRIRYASIQQFFKFLAEEGEIRDSPMAKMHPPKVVEKVTPLLTEQDLERLFSTCKGQDFESRRDLALLRFFMTTGARRSEGAGLRHSDDDPEVPSDLDLDAARAKVLGKGERERWVKLDKQTVRAIDRYLRMRAKHEDAAMQWLWLGKRGRLTAEGIRQVLERRADEAGLPHVHLHQFRHTFAHYYLADGGQESDLMELAGWKSPEMVRRYAASMRQDRALAAAARIGIGNRV